MYMTESREATLSVAKFFLILFLRQTFFEYSFYKKISPKTDLFQFRFNVFSPLKYNTLATSFVKANNCKKFKPSYRYRDKF